MNHPRYTQKIRGWLFVAIGVIGVCAVAGPLLFVTDFANASFESQKHRISFYGVTAMVVRLALAFGCLVLALVGWRDLRATITHNDT